MKPATAATVHPLPVAPPGPAVEELQRDGRFMRVSPASLRESHPHDVVIAKEAPNYRVP